MQAETQQKKLDEPRAPLSQASFQDEASPEKDLGSPRGSLDDAPVYVIGTCYICGMDCSPNSQACKTCVAKTFRFF